MPDMTDIALLNETEHIADVFIKVMQKVMTDDLGAGGLTSAQLQALKHIVSHESSTIGSISEGLMISQPAVTMLVDRMAKRGLVYRQTPEGDRRQSLVLLTDRAGEIIRLVEQERIGRLCGILVAMKGDDRVQFVRSLEKFVAAALKVENDADVACLRCGTDHKPHCVVNRAHIELAGKDIERK